MSKNVLIVEDDELTLSAMREALEDEGYDVSTAANGLEAIEGHLKHGKNFCAIILDMMLPIMNGWQFLDHVRSTKEYSGIPVIVCSRHKETARTVKPDVFIEKPVDLDKLKRAIEMFCK